MSHEEHPPPPDGALARRWQEGDAQAAERLIDRHLPKMRAFLRARCGEAADADDLLQEVFAAACRTIGSYRPEYAFSGWLYGIARNKLADFWRKRQPMEIFEEKHAGADDRSPAFIFDEVDSAERAWKEVFARLPEAQAMALWLKVQEDLRLGEIADALDVTLSNAKVLLFRARQTLAGCRHFRAMLT